MNFELWSRIREEKNHFVHDMNVKLDYMGVNTARVSLMVEKRHLNINETVHGGVYMSLADTAAGAACMYLREIVTTMDLQCRFLSPARIGQRLAATANIVKTGRTILVAEIDITADGKLVAKATSSFYRIHQEPPYFQEIDEMERKAAEDAAADRERP
ncbi:MAG: PaaI family thioesterase [Ndongobacter sp.]|nr:PaaI family thioesterase [Ndongobacter sp.]